jgi:hypothetical protein
MYRSGLAWLAAAFAAGSSCAALPEGPMGPSLAGDVSGGGNAVHAIAWSADGSEIFFVGYTMIGGVLSNLEVKAAKVDGSGTRIVEPFAPHRFYSGLAAPPDASALYTTIGDVSTSDATTYTLVDVLGNKPIGQVGSAADFAASGDDRHVVSMDTTASIFDASTGAMVQSSASLGGGSWAGIAFSPAGDQFFVATPDGGYGMTFDIAGNVLATPTIPVQGSGLAAPSWNADGLRLLYADTNQAFQILNVTNGTTTTVAVPTAASGQVDARAAWSPDGTKVVFWDNVCTDGGTDCSISKNNLRTDAYVADAKTGVATSVIGAKDFFSGDLAVSPDGKRLAYTSITNLYVVDLP